MSRVNVGRTFADKDKPSRWYVVLKVDHVYALVWWEGGEPHAVPVSEMKRRKIKLDSFDFPMSQLLHRWGITARQLDEFLESGMYRHEPDVSHVRSTRKPTNGRTTHHLKHRHKNFKRT